MNRITWAAVSALLIAAAPALAQQPGPQAGEPDFAEHLFPPELIMQNQQRIGLRPEQRTVITGAIRELQNKVIDLQWRIQEETQRLRELLQAAPVDETSALAQVDRILGIEREVKKAHLRMLIQIKNALTPEQQQMLRRLRDNQAPTRPPPGGERH